MSHGTTTGDSKGFALVSTLLLMTILLVVGVGLLSLSSITSRSSGISSAKAQAQANARMALMMAIGDLQQYTGADTRVTAPSTISDPNSPQLLGAWRSWEGKDHSSTGQPIAPAYTSKNQAERDGGRFLKWLVSGAGTGENPTSPANFAASQALPGTVPMLAQGTLHADNPRQVHLTPTLIDGRQGGFAWWISGENQKARLLEPYRPANEDPASWADTARSHAVPDPEVFGLGSLHQDPSPVAKVITLGTTDLIADPAATTKPHQHFLDFSTSAAGLLTNTATGGWRKDMSLATENWDKLPSSNPFFRISPLAGGTSQSYLPTPADPQPNQAMLYPWSDYSNTTGNYASARVGAVGSWHSLKDYATLYKRITNSGNYDLSLPDAWDKKYVANLDQDGSAPNIFKHLHLTRVTPVISRVQWILSHKTTASGVNPVTLKPRYAVQLVITPVLTLWNPYNVSITSPGNLNFRLAKSPPFLLKYYRSDGTILEGKKLLAGTISGGADPSGPAGTPILFNLPQMEFTIQQPSTLQPGETNVYSPRIPYISGVPIMEPGYRPNATGYVANIRDSNARGSLTAQPNLILEADDLLKVDIEFSAEINIGGFPGTGVWLDVFNNNWVPIRDYNIWRYLMVIPTDIAKKYWPAISSSELAKESASFYANNPRPFLSTIFGSRMSSDTPLMDQSLPKTRGLLQSNPLMSYTPNNSPASIKGSRHPINRSFDFSFIPHTSANDSRLPNVDPGTNRGYIATGPSAANGLSRMILCELPLRPLASIAELQHWDMRSHNPYPPFQLNIIGNSDATPLIPSNRIRLSGFQHDDSYCANHVLFDDWFFSSIAPDSAGFGSVSGLTMRQRHEQWLNGERPLTNRNYRPLAEDQALDASAKTKLIDDLLDNDDGWQRIASHIEVEGMFNVNSTSVAAWRAILGHCRGQKIPYFTETSILNSPKGDYLFSRFSVAADLETGKPGGISGDFPRASEFTGYRVFNDAMIDALAVEMVEQVRLRGPFLSLSEFINRQLSSGDLALAGALQTAINKAVENGAANPFKILKDPEYAMDAGVETIPGQLDGSEYTFMQAALGKSTYGLPGWIRQADVLRPIAPILTARDDTFTIRAYGDHRDSTGKVDASAWCEAVVRRDRDFVEPNADEADCIDSPQSPANERFGRQYKIISFRWLSPQEI